MKFRDLLFLTKSNLKGNKNTKVLTVLICLLVVAVTVISSYSVVTVTALNKYKEDYMTRALWLDPYLGALTDEARSAIASVEHVEVVADTTGVRWCPFEFTDIEDEAITEKKNTTDTYLQVHGLCEGEEKSIIKGRTLDDAPVFSCLVPSIFYPFLDEGNIHWENLDYIDGRTLIGKKIKVRGFEGKLYINYCDYHTNSDGYHNQKELCVPSPEYTLEIVGTYYCSPTTSGHSSMLYVSRETDLLMTQMALEGGGYDLQDEKDEVSVWWNDPSLHIYYVVVDEYENISEVFNDVRMNMGYDISSSSERTVDDSLIILATLFRFAGTFLSVAIVLVSAVLLVQSSTNAILERRGYIGLMKSIGYKNRQIFLSLCFEQFYLTLRAAFLGGIISTLLVFLINLRMEHGTFNHMMYLMDWELYCSFLGLSLLIAIFIPFITQIFILNKLTKIQPKDAMSAG